MVPTLNEIKVQKDWKSILGQPAQRWLWDKTPSPGGGWQKDPTPNGWKSAAKAGEKSHRRRSQSSAVLGCICAQETRESQPRRYGQRREKNSSEREVANSPNNCHNKKKRISARLNLAYPGWTINWPESAGMKGSSKETGGEGSTEKKRARN